METGFTVKQEVVVQIVTKHFNNISSAQWCLLAAGDFDSETGAILADMCTEIAQKLSADTLKTILPMFQEHMSENKAKCVAPVMDGAMNSAFASALSVPEQPCDYANKLDSLLSDEISQRVNRSLAVATDSEDEPLVPVIYVPGTFTKLEVLYKMVRLSCGALWSYLGSVESTTRCLGPCWRQQSGKTEEPQSPKSSSSAKSNISVGETTEAVTEILRKWSEPTGSESSGCSPKTSPDLHGTASDIVSTIVSDLHYTTKPDKKKSILSSPHFDLRLIQKTLTNFFCSRPNPTPRQEVARKSSFVEFSKNRFEKLVTAMVSPDVQKESDFMVQRPSACRTASDEGSLPTSNLNTPGSPPPLNFEGIQNDVEDLYKKFPMEGPKVNKTLENLRDDITKFSKVLSSKIYDYIKDNQGSLSTEFSHKSRKRKAQHPQVMKNIVEDSVGKFLQQVLLWMEMEPRKRKANADEVCGALKDIDSLITGIVTSEQETQSSQEASDSESESGDFTTSDNQQTEGEMSSLDPIMTESSLKEVTRNFVSMLIITLVKRFPKKVRKSLMPDDMLWIIRRLSDKVLKINLVFLAGEDMVSYSQFIQAVVKYLCRQFHPQDRLLEALLSDGPSFDDAVLTHLTNMLNGCHDEPEPSRIKRFFSALGKALKKPFTVFSSDR